MGGRVHSKKRERGKKFFIIAEREERENFLRGGGLWETRTGLKYLNSKKDCILFMGKRANHKKEEMAKKEIKIILTSDKKGKENKWGGTVMLVEVKRGGDGSSINIEKKF